MLQITAYFKLDLTPSKFNVISIILKNKKASGHAPAYSFLKNDEEILTHSKNYDSATLWIGTVNGIINFDLTNHKCNYLPLPGTNINNDNIFTTNIFKDCKGNIWLGTSNGGIHIYNPILKRFIEGKGCYTFTNKFANIIVNHIIYDNENNIWLATNTGLYKIKMESNSWSVKKTPGGTNLTDAILRLLYKDRDGILWIGSVESGLYRFDSKRNQFLNFHYNINDKNSLLHNYITSISEDSLYIWAGTPIGLNRIDKKTLLCSRYFKNGFTSRNISGILPAGCTNLWLSTNKGISLFNTADSSIINFDRYDGLINSAFIRRAAYKSTNGEMFFGNGQGLVSFYPDSVKYNKHIPPIYLTNFMVMGKETKTENDLEELKEINLKYNENFIQFDFSALDYTAPLRNQYKYKLDGIDNDWISAGNRRFASYTQLKSGTYFFRVIGSNNDGYWNTKGLVIKINVIPPFWQTFWFRFIILILVLFIASIFYKTKVNSIKEREKQLESLNRKLLLENAERQKAELEMKKAKEIAENADRLKSEFLAQMSHEIRTPINAILSFSSLIREDVAEYLSAEMKDGFSIIDRAGRRLIRTVDLILNMSLLQTDSFELSFQRLDLYEKILKKKIGEYSILAEGKGLEFKVIKEAEDCTIYSDEAILDQIFDNLFNNAVKFTKLGEIRIDIFSDKYNHLVVEINDTGVGISEEYKSNLFKPFLQEESGYARRFEGNGLGLALTKKYCDLARIKISIKSKKGTGTKVILQF